MNAIRILEKEHKVILMVINGMESEARRIKAEDRLDTPHMARIIDFSRHFISACHHAKEEEYLFARLRACNLPDGNTLMDELIDEHQEGSSRIDRLDQGLGAAEGGDRETLPALSELLADYAALVRRHIDKENHILFPLADTLLSPEEQTDLVHAFDRIEMERIGPGEHEKYHELANELAKRS